MESLAPDHSRVTAIVTCFNEEKTIEACLKSLTWVDEIMVVDSFSTDGTLEIAARYSDRILQHEYLNSAAQKNWAMHQAKYPWVLIVDSDERVTPALRQEIEGLLAAGPEKSGYQIKRITYLFGKRIRYSGWGHDFVMRFSLRDKTRYQDKRVHSGARIENSGTLKGVLEHHTIDSISSWLIKINRYSSWKALDKFEQGTAQPLLHMVLRPPMRFLKDFILRLGILDGWRGFLIAAMSAFAELVMAAKLVLHYLEQPQSE